MKTEQKQVLNDKLLDRKLQAQAKQQVALVFLGYTLAVLGFKQVNFQLNAGLQVYSHLSDGLW